MPKITVHLPDGTTASHELTDDLVTVGRLSDNTIQIDDISVSSNHAQFIFVESGYILKDLESTNGTRLNGIGLKDEKRLEEGDSIMFGKIVCEYHSENPADAIPMPAEGKVDLQPAESSARPANFSNASPFQTKKKKKDPSGKAVMALAAVAVLAFVGAVVMILGLQPPSLS